MHKCKYTDRIEIKSGVITRIITAHYKNYSVDVFKQSENGKLLCRYLYIGMCGYYVAFPHETYKINGITYTEEIQQYSTFRNNILPALYCHNSITQKDLDKIYSKYPDFKYVFKKLDTDSLSVVMSCLCIWIKHKEIEYLISLNQNKLAFGSIFYTCSESTRKKIVSFLLHHKNLCKEITFSYQDILSIIKYNVKDNLIIEYVDFRRKYGSGANPNIFKYFTKQSNKGKDISFNKYKQYLKYLSKDKKKNEYWLYPNDFERSYAIIKNEYEEIQRLKMEEAERIAEEARIERDRKEAEELKTKAVEYVKKVSSLFNLKESIDSFDIFIPENVDVITKQAIELHQCLIRCNYINKVLNDQCVLVFIYKNKLPYATVEILPGNKIGQFYLDEEKHDGTSYIPDEYTKSIFNKWFEGKNILGEKVA